MMKAPLTKTKAAWAKNRNVALRGNTLAYNVSLQIRYQQEIQTLISEMNDEVKKQLIRLFNGEIADDFFSQQEVAAAMDASITVKAKKVLNVLTAKFERLFDVKSAKLVLKMAESAKKSSDVTLKSSLKQLSGGLTLKTSIVPKGMEEVFQAIVAENVSLIKSIPKKYLDDVTGSVMRSISTGQGLADLLPDIAKYKGITYRRARMISLDQTRKAYNLINKQKLQSLGVKQFEWLHSGGSDHPRESHKKISGVIFNFENIEEQQARLKVPDNDRGLPGVPINCRCTMTPVIKFEE